MSNEKWAKKHREELKSKYKNRLYDLKVNKRYSLQQCKEILSLDISLSTLKIWCTRWNIPVASTYPTGKNHWKSIKQNITKEMLNKYYIDQKKSAKECGEMLKTSGATILKLLKKYDIPRRAGTDEPGENSRNWQGRKVIVCPICNMKKEVPINSKRIYCSKTCVGKSIIGENHPNYKGGTLAGRQRLWKQIKNNPKKMLEHRVSGMVFYSSKNGKMGKKTSEILDYSYEELYDFLGLRMPKGYNWNDYLEGKLHLDHKVPLSYFKYDTYEDIEFKKCWSLYNLQLLPAKENMQKSNKVDYKDLENLNKKFKLQSLVYLTKKLVKKTKLLEKKMREGFEKEFGYMIDECII